MSEKKPRKPREKKSEADIVRQYAAGIMERQRTRGHMNKAFRDQAGP